MTKEKSPDLHQLSEQVHDEKSLIAFMKALVADKEAEIEYEKAIRHGKAIGRPTNEWQNGSVEMYLECAAAWAETQIQKSENPWTRFAQILLAGKYYE